MCQPFILRKGNLEEIERRDSLPGVIMVKEHEELVKSTITEMLEVASYGNGITAGIRKATSDWNGALLINGTGNAGSGGYVLGGRQYAIDWHGNVVAYRVYGTGVEVGSSAKISTAVGYLNVPSAEDAGGLGTETGGSFGEGLISGLSWITANEDNGDYIASGAMVNLSLGAEASGMEGHESLTYAKKLYSWNIFDVIDNSWNFLNKIFNETENEELCKN